MAEKVVLHNIKGITELSFQLPQQTGVYLLAGSNGSGKTSLLIALNRIGDNTAFSDYNVSKQRGNFDQFKDATIDYYSDSDKVSYVHGMQRWVPSPRTKANILSTFRRNFTLFISTTGIRFYQQIPNIKTKKGLQINYANTADWMKGAMNEILGTDKFSDLKYVTVRPKRGKQKTLRRENKLYAIKKAGQDAYTEISFSLGERLVLNTLEKLNEAAKNSIVLIDEIELALHPLAQTKFYDYLNKFASSKNSVVIISTHSASLFKHAKKNIYYLDRNADGTVNVVEDCSAAYILKDVSAMEERQFDFVFLVEDINAELYLNNLFQIYREKDKTHEKKLTKVLYVGGYYEVVKLTKQISSMPPYSANKIQAFLDKDVEQEINRIKAKVGQTPSEREKIECFDSMSNNISYLDITPELGFWDWLRGNAEKYDTYLINHYGRQIFSMRSLVDKVINEEKPEPQEDAQKRQWAKGCLKNLSEKLLTYFPPLKENDIYNDFFCCLAEEKMKDAKFFNQYRGLFGSLLNRK